MHRRTKQRRASDVQHEVDSGALKGYGGAVQQEDEYDVVVVGAGVSGIAAAHYLRSAQSDIKMCVIEKGPSVGGTWHYNRYPGAACDVPSHWYSFSFALNPFWSRRFSVQEEIQEYMEKVCISEGLMPLIFFNTTVLSTTWNESAGAHDILTTESIGAAGRCALRARFVIAGPGALSTPNVPTFAGMDKFKGPIFHSAQWDKSVALEGKRVGIIGTGCSSAQIVPALAPLVGNLVLFQRTPAWVSPRGDHGYHPLVVLAFAYLPGILWLYRMFLMVMHDLRYFAFIRPVHPVLQRYAAGASSAHLASQVPEPQLRAQLTPQYAFGCKRVIISDDFYPALTRSNVTLVTKPITSVTASGIRVEGNEEHALDVLVLATGFDVVASMDSLNVTGREGARMIRKECDPATKKSSGAGAVNDSSSGNSTPDAYLGVACPSYPNLFLMMGPNTGLGHSSMITMIEAQARFAAEAIAGALGKRLHSIEVKREVCENYNRMLQKELLNNVWGGCQSWYNLQGVVSSKIPPSVHSLPTEDE